MISPSHSRTTLHGWTYSTSEEVHFSDSEGQDLYVDDFFHQSDGLALKVGDDDSSALEMEFDISMREMGLAFGNDAPDYTDPGDEAVLTVFRGGAQVGQVSKEMNRNDDKDQRIALSGTCTLPGHPSHRGR